MSTDKKYCIKLEECECGDGVATLPDLSYEEQYAGYHDYDGFKVYVKDIELGAAPSTTTNRSIPHNIPSVRSIVKHESTLTDGSGGKYCGNIYSPGDHIRFHVSKEAVWVASVGNWQTSNYKMAIRIYYTCTDR